MAITLDGTLGITSPDFEPSGSTTPTNGLFLPAANAVGFATNSSERVRIDSSGNVGIGTSSPGAKLEVNGNVILGQEVYRNSATSLLRLAGGSAAATGAGISLFGESHATLPNTLSFFNSGSERMRLDSSGNLGLGVTPSAWYSAAKTFQIGYAGAIYANTGVAQTKYLNNAYYNASGNPIYLNNGYAQDFSLNNSGQYAWYTAPSGTAGNAISFTQAMTLDASGNLGIGTSSPSTYGKLVVYGGSSVTSPNLAIVSTAFNSGQGCSLDFVRDGFTQPINARILTADNGAAASYLNFQTKADGTAGALATRMTLDSSGNLFVGKTVTGLGIAGVQFSSTGWGQFTVSGDASLFTNRLTSDGATVKFYRNTVEVGSISVTSSATAYNTGSDQRLKTNIIPAGSAIQSILDFPVDQFDWIADGSHVEFGAVAQKAINVIPEMVSVPADPEEMWGIDWSKAVPRLIKTIQELTARLEALENKS